MRRVLLNSETISKQAWIRRKLNSGEDPSVVSRGHSNRFELSRDDGTKHIGCARGIRYWSPISGPSGRGNDPSSCRRGEQLSRSNRRVRRGRSGLFQRVNTQVLRSLPPLWRMNSCDQASGRLTWISRCYEMHGSACVATCVTRMIIISDLCQSGFFVLNIIKLISY